MIPELAVSLLACAKIGAIHSVVFGGFSPSSLRDRIVDSDSVLVITSDEGVRGGKAIPMKKNCDAALDECPSVTDVIVVRRTGGDVIMKEGRDTWLDEELSAPDITDECAPESVDSEDPLFILYTSGSTGKPKGVLHTTGGYLLYSALTFKWIFDYKDEDIFFCTADIGWVTGTLLHNIRTARHGRHRTHVRGHTYVPQPRQVLGDRRKTPGQQLLHRAYGDTGLMKYDDELVTKHDLRQP